MWSQTGNIANKSEKNNTENIVLFHLDIGFFYDNKENLTDLSDLTIIECNF